MYSASSGSIQPLPTRTWYKYSSWPKDSSTSLRPQLGLYIPYFVLERERERERLCQVLNLISRPYVKRELCVGWLTKSHGCWWHPGIMHLCYAPSGSLPTDEIQLAVTHVQTMCKISKIFQVMISLLHTDKQDFGSLKAFIIS